MQEFTHSKVMVVGDVMLDDYWEGSTERISPEAPVPVVHMANRTGSYQWPHGFYSISATNCVSF